MTAPDDWGDDAAELVRTSSSADEDQRQEDDAAERTAIEGEPRGAPSAGPPSAPPGHAPGAARPGAAVREDDRGRELVPGARFVLEALALVYEDAALWEEMVPKLS